MKKSAFLAAACLFIVTPMMIWTRDDLEPSSKIALVDSSDASGFYLERVYDNPFGDVIDPHFSLATRSVVTVFFTDTLLSETSYVSREETLDAGRYRVSFSAVSEYRKKIAEEFFFLHLDSESTASTRDGWAHAHSYSGRALVWVP